MLTDLVSQGHRDYNGNMKQLDPKAVWLFFIGSLIAWFFVFFFLSLFLLPGLAAIIQVRNNFPNDLTLSWAAIKTWLGLAVIVWIAFSYLWARLTYHFYRYELTDNGFRKESGVIWKKYVSIPYERIQNVDIYRGIWARILGLSDLQIQTAGMSAMVGR